MRPRQQRPRWRRTQKGDIRFQEAWLSLDGDGNLERFQHEYSGETSKFADQDFKLNRTM
jgi:hypothetical protein